MDGGSEHSVGARINLDAHTKVVQYFLDHDSVSVLMSDKLVEPYLKNSAGVDRRTAEGVLKVGLNDLVVEEAELEKEYQEFLQVAVVLPDAVRRQLPTVLVGLSNWVMSAIDRSGVDTGSFLEFETLLARLGIMHEGMRQIALAKETLEERLQELSGVAAQPAIEEVSEEEQAA